MSNFEELHRSKHLPKNKEVLHNHCRQRPKGYSIFTHTKREEDCRIIKISHRSQQTNSITKQLVILMGHLTMPEQEKACIHIILSAKRREKGEGSKNFTQCNHTYATHVPREIRHLHIWYCQTPQLSSVLIDHQTCTILISISPFESKA